VTAPLPGIVGVPYQLAAAANGQIGTVTWAIASGGLPPGVVLNASTGLIGGTPTAAGVFTALIEATDSGTVTRSATQSVTILVNANIAIVTSALAAGNVGSPYSATLAATGGAGVLAWSLAPGSLPLPAGLTLDANGVISGAPTALGSSRFTIAASDSSVPANVATKELTLAVNAREIVLRTSTATIVGSSWSQVVDSTAADGKRVSNPDRGAKQVKNPSSSPASYVDVTFQAEAGVAYHVWLRAKADRNSTANDSVYVQFSSSVDANGSAIARIGTTQSAVVILENSSGAGVSGWGWQDTQSNGGLAQPIYFRNSGSQTIRLQQREDGISIDQIVLSAATYLSASPGALKNDTVIVPK
jgi:putative Ig domain-containing protein